MIYHAFADLAFAYAGWRLSADIRRWLHGRRFRIDDRDTVVFDSDQPVTLVFREGKQVVVKGWHLSEPEAEAMLMDASAMLMRRGLDDV